MSPLWTVGLLCAAILAAFGLWGWLARRLRVHSAVYRHGGWWYREWRRPYVTAVTSADRRYGLVRNRYVDHIVIGIALHVGHRGLSLVWARPRYDRDPPFDDWTDQALDVVAEVDPKGDQHA